MQDKLITIGLHISKVQWVDIVPLLVLDNYILMFDTCKRRGHKLSFKIHPN
jgi:hypothetical protein